MDAQQVLPPEAWDAVSKTGNAASIVLGILFFRIAERLGKLSERVTVLETKLGVKGKSDVDET